MLRSYLYFDYSDELDFFGQDLISLTNATKAEVKARIPELREDWEMRRRWGFTRKLTTFNTGEVADEVHEFHSATMGSFRLKRILLRKGQVIEICFQSMTIANQRRL